MEACKPSSRPAWVAVGFWFIVLAAALRQEAKDLHKVESARIAALEGTPLQACTALPRFLEDAKAVRGVQWRMAATGATVLTTVLALGGVLPAAPHAAWLTTFTVAWIVISGILSFRGYHLEYEVERTLEHAQPAMQCAA